MVQMKCQKWQQGLLRENVLQTSGQTQFLKENLLLLLYGHLRVTSQKLQTLILKNGFTLTIKFKDILFWLSAVSLQRALFHSSPIDLSLSNEPHHIQVRSEGWCTELYFFFLLLKMKRAKQNLRAVGRSCLPERQVAINQLLLLIGLLPLTDVLFKILRLQGFGIAQILMHAIGKKPAHAYGWQQCSSC